MAGPAGANAPPLGVVIDNGDGTNSIWDGKQWAPATKDSAGNWRRDNAKLSAMGMGGASGPLNPDDAKRVAAMQTDLDNVDGLANTATDFMSRNAKTPTGGLLAIPGATSIAKAFQGSSSDLAAMDRDNSQMAVQMRTPGMRLTQMEFGKFLGATPSPKNTQDQNAQIAQSIYAARTLAAGVVLHDLAEHPPIACRRGCGMARLAQPALRPDAHSVHAR
jgi:hypothetical protein